ncbi:hypothetical protein EDWATA_02093 [Edwardsiella tarda ATCC 23685]|uniref:Uncharacterized protein n=1 Tax=Edwardsiella tarda ATCC 23685 TaxID=500638 RepID=D4F5R5_EDWTA|nr:hypothetical protein EDWATA_02093 [Edwardsiella tarda ATCC 23685]
MSKYFNWCISRHPLFFLGKIASIFPDKSLGISSWRARWGLA